MVLRAPQHISHRIQGISARPDRRRRERDRPGLTAGLLGGACVLGLFILLGLLYSAG